MNKQQKIKTALIGLFLILSWSVYAQIPEKPSQEQLVNDFANIYTAQERAQLESFLDMVDDSTSNQICIVTVADLGGMDKNQFGTELFHNWGIGDKKLKNGVLLLIKPKTGREKGEVQIITGYGLEGALPDVICRRIVAKITIPYFKQNDYFTGSFETVKVIAKIAQGEYDVDRLKDDYSNRKIIFIALILVVFIIVFVSKRKNNGNNGGNTTYGGGTPWIFFGGGGFGGGSSDGGGFGGFGGGDTGGGGAGGSW